MDLVIKNSNGINIFHQIAQLKWRNRLHNLSLAGYNKGSPNVTRRTSTVRRLLCIYLHMYVYRCICECKCEKCDCKYLCVSFVNDLMRYQATASSAATSSLSSFSSPARSLHLTNRTRLCLRMQTGHVYQCCTFIADN